MLITRPNYDITTSYLFEWSKKIIKTAEKKGIKCIDLKDDRTNKKEFENLIKKSDPNLVVFNGHGNDDRILGQDGKSLIKYRENHELLGSKIVYARSCKSAKKLGKECVKSGTKVYIGYDEDFIFSFNKSKTTNPLKDDMAKPFFESSNIIPISIIKGNTVRESIYKSQKTFEKWIDYYKTHYTIESQHIMFFLRWDMIVQKALGNLEACI